MGSAVFNCHYQQNPVAPEGSPLRWEWFGSYNEVLPRVRYQLIVQSWDTGMSADPRSDWSASTIWGYLHPHWHLLDVWRGQLDYPDLRARVLALVNHWAPGRILIEVAATGRPLLDELARAGRDRRFVRITPDRDKEIRFAAACAPVEEGKVCLPREAPWLAAFRRELQAFPRGRNDDQVDSFTQFLNWTKGLGFLCALPHEHPLRERRRRNIRRKP
ncbi:putative phage terminase large subunit-like protein [Albidovulum inexpectatum]|uniref:Putative phage terminase large subunit-like protein n=1 Tax=Albidovulum inexpectatum TaxID=196587 RepID=A0A2S5JG30_9RHOB|nr:phage terminase large subunit [Albidovulum inexpectatum]PPB80351.1 putative phage terminase large subunit-like protein [Albidovulum inexpectatum]